jgi:uncharacterized tellurite resistance protein B-like protein
MARRRKKSQPFLSQLADGVLGLSILAGLIVWAASSLALAIVCVLVGVLCSWKLNRWQKTLEDRAAHRAHVARVLPQHQRVLEDCLRLCQESKNPRTRVSRATLALERIATVAQLSPGMLTNRCDLEAYFGAVRRVAQLATAYEKAVTAKTKPTRTRNAGIVQEELGSKPITDADLRTADAIDPTTGEHLTLAAVRATLAEMGLQIPTTVAPTLAPSPVREPVSVDRQMPPAPAAPSRARWIPSGQAVRIRGYDIPGGMVYAGRGLPSVASPNVVEAALLDPTLDVDPRRPDHNGREMDYWPSFSEVHPQCRAAYLEWLANGRRTPAAYIGYVFLFFYGLERRLLHDAVNENVSREEVETTRAEVERLLDLYGGNRSFRSYAGGLLHTLDAVLPTHLRRDPDLDTPPRFDRTWELPLSLRIALGTFATRERLVPWPWALSWVLCHPESRLRTPATRCEEEFKAVFARQYAEAFGDGMLLLPVKRRITHTYRPASPSFRGRTISVSPNLPDVANARRPFEKLQAIVDRCCDDLDALSRFLGRNPDARGSLLATALLPSSIPSSMEGEEARAVRSVIESQLSGHDSAVIDAGDLVERWPRAKNGRLTKTDSVLLAQLLARWDLGLVPDVRFGGKPLRSDGKAVLFRLPADSPTAPSPAFPAAALILHLAMAVASADGTVSEEEEQGLEAHLESSLQLTNGERARLRAHVTHLLAEPPGMAGIKKRVEPLPLEQRANLAALLVGVACADGHVDPDEVKVLTKIYRLLGLDPGRVHSDLHAASLDTAADEPVVVRPAGDRSAGYAVPRPPTEDRRPGVRLDRESIERKLGETAVVSALLRDIFEERDEEPTVPEPVEDEGEAIGGLDVVHSTLLRRLIERDEWGRAEFDDMAQDLGLMPDGALEVVNDVAFEACDAPLCEGDDPLEVDLDVAKELVA